MKKILLILLIVLGATCVFSKDLLNYKVEEIIKDSEKYNYSVQYPLFDTNKELGIFANRQLEETFKKTEEFMEKWEKAAEIQKTKEYIKIDCMVSRCDVDVISGYFKIIYTVGKDTNIYYETFNMGIIDGKPKNLELKDCYSKSIDVLWKGAYGELKNNPKAQYIADGKVTMDIEPDGFREKFVITKNYITFIFDPGVLAPEENGEFMYKIKYTFFPD